MPRSPTKVTAPPPKRVATLRIWEVTVFGSRCELAVEAGAKRILIPSENKRDISEIPDAILTAIQWQFYDSPTKAAMMSLGLI